MGQTRCEGGKLKYGVLRLWRHTCQVTSSLTTTRTTKWITTRVWCLYNSLLFCWALTQHEASSPTIFPSSVPTTPIPDHMSAHAYQANQAANPSSPSFTIDEEYSSPSLDCLHLGHTTKVNTRSRTPAAYGIIFILRT